MQKSSLCVLTALVLLFGVTVWCAGGSEQPIYAAELDVVPTATRSVKPTMTSYPTPTFVPTLTPKAAVSAPVQPDGALIWLHVHFVSANALAAWQDLHTVVQWQDALGCWHDVEGWRGSLDDVVKDEGRKVWWLSEDLRGAGPFRWQVYQDASGAPLVESVPFHLPSVEPRLDVEIVFP